MCSRSLNITDRANTPIVQLGTNCVAWYGGSLSFGWYVLVNLYQLNIKGLVKSFFSIFLVVKM